MLPIAYKVVYEGWRGSGIRHSATCSGRTLSYDLQRWTRPEDNDGPLACFMCIEDARSFIGDLSAFVILECEYIPAPFQEYLWFQSRLVGGVAIYSGELPKRTLFAWAVKPLREVVL